MRKIKVLEIIDKTFLGGGQKNLLSLVKNLDKKKFDISVCSNPKGNLVKELERKNIPHFPVSMSKRFSRKPVKNIKALIERENFDIVHTHGGVAGFYGRWAAGKFEQTVVVHTLHGVHYLYYRNFFLKHLYVCLERFFSRFTDAVIFVSKSDQKKGKKFKLASKEKIKLIENGIDYSLFQNKSLGRNIKGEIKKGLVIGTVARLHRQKNIPLLLKAGAKIRKSYPGIEIWVVGGGPLERKLQELSRNLGTSDTVCFLGERTDAPELMARFDLFVLPSLWEGLPYVLLEAAALKKPVIGTNIDGIREIIENDKTGILVSPKNPDELVGAAIRLLNNRLFAEKLGLNLYKKVCEKYSISLTINKIQKLYIQLFRQIERSST